MEMGLKKNLILAFCIMILPEAAMGYSALDNAKISKLENGIKVILKENHDLPLVSLQVWVRVGALNEIPEINGISHFMEHMMFKGTKKFDAGQISHEVESWGGVINAATSDEFTYYYIDIPSEAYPKVLEILYEISAVPTFPEDEMERERLVILEEISRKDDNPHAMLWDKLRPLAYRKTPYKNRVIGTADVIKQISKEDMIEYFRRHYVSNNMVFIAVGDFDSARMTEQLDETFGKIPAGVPPELPILIEPYHEGAMIMETADVNQIYFLGGFLGPDFNSPDQYALDVLAVILGQGASSRLHQNLYEKEKIVWSIGSSFMTNNGSGLFNIRARLKENRIDEFLDKLYLEINTIKKEMPSKSEIIRAKRQLETNIILSNETNRGLASGIGYYALYNKEKFLREYLGNLKKVKASDVRKVAEEYLVIKRMDIAIIKPKVEDLKKGGRQ